MSAQNGSPADCSSSFCLAFLSGLASLSVCLSPSGTHFGHCSRPPRDTQFRCKSQRPDVEAEKYLWRVGDVERINRQCSLRFVSLLNQSGKASENTFYFASTVEGNRKQANLVFHQDQNHRQTGLRVYVVGGEGLPFFCLPNSRGLYNSPDAMVARAFIQSCLGPTPHDWIHR